MRKSRNWKFENPKAFIHYSQAVDYIYEHLEDYNPTKKRRMLIVFDDMIANMESNTKLSPKVAELFLREENSIFHLLSYWNLISKYLKL